MKNQIKILLTGGGTGGSVSPLLAIAEEIYSKSDPGEYNFLWLGTKDGIESEMVKKAGIAFKSIHSGKLRRYFSWSNFLAPFFILIGMFESFMFILRWHPKLIISAGSFVSVPVVWAGWLLRIPVIIHQQDIRPGLANKLMTPFCKVVTVTFEKSIKDYGRKARWIGNPIRTKFKTLNYSAAKNKLHDVFKLKTNLPVILVLGGGTGAAAINSLVSRSINELSTFCQIIHLTGKNKPVNLDDAPNKNYKHYEFFNIEQMAEAYAIADVVVSRCGLSTLTELSYLGKPSVLIPMPDSHQEDNASVFEEAKAAIVLHQNQLTPEVFIKILEKLLADHKLLAEYSFKITSVIKRDANIEMVKIVYEVLNI